MGRKMKWPVDEFGYPIVGPDLTSARYVSEHPAVYAVGCPDKRLWNSLKVVLSLLDSAVLLVGVLGLLLLPPILAFPVCHVADWIVETLEGLERALKRTWIDLLSYVEWLFKNTGNRNSQVH